MKVKEESPEDELNEMEVNHLSDKEFRVMVTRVLKQFSENYKQLNEYYTGLNESYINMKKG